MNVCVITDFRYTSYIFIYEFLV